MYLLLAGLGTPITQYKVFENKDFYLYFTVLKHNFLVIKIVLLSVLLLPLLEIVLYATCIYLYNILKFSQAPLSFFT